MPTFKELLRVLEVSAKDKTSGKRMKEIHAILKKHDAFKGLSPEKARFILEDLGPTFVKMGQIASNRGDILPRDYCSAFESLRTNVDPVPFDTIIKIIEDAYGKPWNKTFAAIKKAPLGSASIAQVHEAVLLDGSVVAVKVRREGIVEKMAEDIMLMKHLLALVEFTTTSHDSIMFSLDSLVAELERTTANELDFTIELQNLVRFYHNLGNQPGTSCPLPYPQYSTDEVLVMQFVVGIPINDTTNLTAAGINIEQFAQSLAKSYATQVIQNGFFHADPHPGNILVQNNLIVWIDLGMVGALSEGEKLLVNKVFHAVAMRNSYDLKEALLALSQKRGPLDHGKLLEQMDFLLMSYASSGLADINIGNAFLDLADILRSQNLVLPPSFTMLGRGFLTLEGVLAEIAPSIRIIDIVSEQVKKQYLNPHYLFNKAKDFTLASAQSVEAAAYLPSQISNSLDMLNRGELKFSADMQGSRDLLASFYAVSSRLSLAMISAGLFIGSSVLCTTQMEPRLLGVPFLGFLGYIGAFILSAYVIWQTLKTRHQQRNQENFK